MLFFSNRSFSKFAGLWDFEPVYGEFWYFGQIIYQLVFFVILKLLLKPGCFVGISMNRENGPFQYNYSWKSEKNSKSWAKKGFPIHPDKVALLVDQNGALLITAKQIQSSKHQFENPPKLSWSENSGPNYRFFKIYKTINGI